MKEEYAQTIIIINVVFSFISAFIVTSTEIMNRNGNKYISITSVVELC